MPRDFELEELRKLARARHRAATQKVSRLKSSKNVYVAGTDVDPRRDAAKIKRYNKRQLASYIAKLDQFNSRSTQFVPDAAKRPLSSDLWSQYKSLEAQYNKQVRENFDKVSDIYLPQSGMTIRERMEMVTPKHRAMAYTPVNAQYKPPVRISRNMANEKGLRKMIADMENRMRPDYQDRLIKEARSQFAKMAEQVNDSELAKATTQLSDAQFEVLWNFTPFSRAISLGYEMALAQLSSKEKPWHSQILKTALGDARAGIEWAKSLNLGR